MLHPCSVGLLNRLGLALRLGYYMRDIAVAVLVTVGLAASFGYAYQDRKPDCRKQLAEIGKATFLYTEYNDGFLPPQLTFEVKAIGAKDETSVWMKALLGDKRDDKFFRCPDDKRFGGFGDETKYSLFGTRLYPFSSYGVSLSFMNRGPFKNGAFVNLATVQEPKKTAYVEDILFIQKKSADEGVVVSAHGEKMNVWFLDGHIESRSTKETRPSGM